MKIYHVKADSNNVQWILPKGVEDNLLDVLSFDCVSKKNQYNDISWYIHNPKDVKGNFYTGITGALVFDQIVYDSELFTFFEMAGEIMPIHLETGEELYALNVLECVNMLDKENSVYDYYDDGSKGRILKYSFHKNRLSESSIFKIPETSRTQVLCYSDVHYKDDEFFYMYNELNFTGLVFKEL